MGPLKCLFLSLAWRRVDPLPWVPHWWSPRRWHHSIQGQRSSSVLMARPMWALGNLDVAGEEASKEAVEFYDSVGEKALNKGYDLAYFMLVRLSFP